MKSTKSGQCSNFVNICHNSKIGIEMTKIGHLFNGQKRVNLWTERATGGQWAWGKQTLKIPAAQPSSHCFLRVSALGAERFNGSYR